MTIISLILGFALGAGALVFALQNNEVVALTFLNWQFESSLALVFLLSVGAGLMLGILISLPSIISRSLTIMALRRDRKGLADEASTLRERSQAAEAELVAHQSPKRMDI